MAAAFLGGDLLHLRCNDGALLLDLDEVGGGQLPNSKPHTTTYHPYAPGCAKYASKALSKHCQKYDESTTKLLQKNTKPKGQDARCGHTLRVLPLEPHRPLGRFAPVAVYSGLRPETRKCLPTKAQFALRATGTEATQAVFV